jgi:hypothetical protein
MANLVELAREKWAEVDQFLLSFITRTLGDPYARRYEDSILHKARLVEDLPATESTKKEEIINIGGDQYDGPGSN